MAGQNNSFPCGHRGKGQFCHRCKEEERRKQEARQRKAEWNDRLSSAPVHLDHLPEDIAERVLQVVQELKLGKTYMSLNGKRLVAMGQRDVISIPIGRRYRMICKEKEGAFECVEVITHETYNHRLSSGGWP